MFPLTLTQVLSVLLLVMALLLHALSFLLAIWFVDVDALFNYSKV